MIRVRVELMSAITGETTELARMDIANDGVASQINPRLGDYTAVTYRGRSKAQLDKRTPQKRTDIKGWRRHDYHVWNLVRLALERMGYTNV